MILKHEFVEFIPRELKDGVIYVSVAYATVVHKCCCGCGTQVVTPLAPDQWAMRFDGRTVSLEPSISNTSFPCQSHYWVKEGRIVWVPRWEVVVRKPGTAATGSTDAAAGRAETRAGSQSPHEPGKRRAGLLRRLRDWLRG